MQPRRRDDELAAGGDGGQRSPGRRRLGWVATAVVAGAALAVVRPDLALHGSPTVRPAPTSSASRPAGPTTVAWDIRGDLAGSRGFVSDAVRRIRRESTRVGRILWAGQLPDGTRLALGGTDVAGGAAATTVHAMLAAPGTVVDDGSVTQVATLSDEQQVLTWVGPGTDGRTFAVVLSRPGPVRFEVSGRVDFASDGSASRQWHRVRTRDGAAVVDLGTDVDPVVAVRATGTGVLAATEVVPVASSGGVAGPVHVVGLDDALYGGPRRALLVRGLRESVGGLVDLSAARPAVLWSGAPWKGRRLALVLVTRPDGVRLQTVVGEQDGAAFGAGVRALPVGDPDEVPWLLEPFTSADPTFLLCPTGPGTLVYRRPGRVARLPVPASGAVGIVEPGAGAPSARGASVTLLGPGGRRLVRTVLPDHALDDPLVLGGG